MPDISLPSEEDRAALDLAVSILKRHGARAIYLFGSMASGSARPDSDWDIAVEGLPSSSFFPTDIDEEFSAAKPLFKLGRSRDFDFIETSAAAAILQGFYTSIENLVLYFCKTLDGYARHLRPDRTRDLLFEAPKVWAQVRDDLEGFSQSLGTESTDKR